MKNKPVLSLANIDLVYFQGVQDYVYVGEEQTRLSLVNIDLVYFQQDNVGEEQACFIPSQFQV